MFKQLDNFNMSSRKQISKEDNKESNKEGCKEEKLILFVSLSESPIVERSVGFLLFYMEGFCDRLFGLCHL